MGAPTVQAPARAGFGEPMVLLRKASPGPSCFLEQHTYFKFKPAVFFCSSFSIAKNGFMTDLDGYELSAICCFLS